jgi:hypothetical protein
VNAAFAHLEEHADLPWHIDPRDKDPRSEEKRQLAFLRDARILCPAVNIFAVPNAGRRTQWEVNKAKREGMKSGALDLVCTWNRGVAFLEFKNGTDLPSPNQREQLNTLYRQGHHCGVFRQEQSALDFLRSIGAPFIGRIAA